MRDVKPRDFASILKHVTFPGLEFKLVQKGTVNLLMVHCPTGICNFNKGALPWNGRKFYLSQWMTDSEVIQTAFMAVRTAMEHEVREQFKYKGQAVLQPHMDLEELLKNGKTLSERS